MGKEARKRVIENYSAVNVAARVREVYGRVAVNGRVFFVPGELCPRTRLARVRAHRRATRPRSRRQRQAEYQTEEHPVEVVPPHVVEEARARKSDVREEHPHEKRIRGSGGAGRPRTERPNLAQREPQAGGDEEEQSLNN